MGTSMSAGIGGTAAISPGAASTPSNGASPSGAPKGTLGSELRESPAVRAAIATIVKEVRTRAEKITDVRGPSAALRESFAAYTARAGEVRGRALYYPYVSSGIGNGALVELTDGSVKWDMLSGIGVNFFGHSEPDLLAAGLEGAISDCAMAGHLQAGDELYRFAETLLGEARKVSKMDVCFVAPTGVLANENALKVAYQKHAPASRVIAFKDCFMGRTVTMSQIGDLAANRVGMPLSTLVDYMPFWDPQAAEQMGKGRFIDASLAQLTQYFERYPKQYACFIFELVQGEGGFNVADRDWVLELMRCCKAHGVAVWDDEVQTFGRTQSMFAFEAFGAAELVDIVCVGKLTQACATLFTREYNPQPGLLSSTFAGGNAALRVGTRVLERLRDGGYYGPDGLISIHHNAFTQQVRALAKRHPALFPLAKGIPDVAGGTGGMMRFSPFGGDKDKVVRLCHVLFEEGVIAFYAGHGPYHVRMLPPLGVMKPEDWPRVFAVVERALIRVAAEKK